VSAHEQSFVHIASVRLLLVVWVALIFGTWLTVSASNVDLGFLNIWIGLAIATGKAVLVTLYYMHLRWDKPFNAFVFLSAFFFLFLFIGFAMMDTAQYQIDLIPGYSPGMAGHGRLIGTHRSSQFSILNFELRPGFPEDAVGDVKLRIKN